ncbi:MAG: outer membrane lipoprotein chaperone LolA [Xanthomonadales bacterium]|nr:outer membrane lipoprotein chaperone LolA [Xanthomonadales bacterium]MDZ4377966.1 outer membrane lipoprotein chaperone LolA [Xanthomonadaceae bacterium]
MTRLIFALVLLASSTAAMAAARDQFNQFTQGIKVLDGQFSQQVFDPQGQLSESSSGRIALAKPRQFRWEYAQPFPQLIVADGKHVWVFDPDLEQVSVRQQSLEEQQSPLAGLIDPAVLERQFKFAEGGDHDGMRWLVLTPLQGDDAQLRQAWLGFGDGELRQMELRDALDQRTVIVFTNWRRNPKLAADTFRFTPPEGADVIGDMGEDAEVFPQR